MTQEAGGLPDQIALFGQRPEVDGGVLHTLLSLLYTRSMYIQPKNVRLSPMRVPGVTARWTPHEMACGAPSDCPTSIRAAWGGRFTSFFAQRAGSSRKPVVVAPTPCIARQSLAWGQAGNPVASLTDSPLECGSDRLQHVKMAIVADIGRVDLNGQPPCPIH